VKLWYSPVSASAPRRDSRRRSQFDLLKKAETREKAMTGAIMLQGLLWAFAAYGALTGVAELLAWRRGRL